MSKIAVIIPAAGKGERFGGRENKAFAKLDGRPLFMRAIELFVNRDDVCQIILAVSPEDMDTVKTRYGANIAFMGVKLVEGGARRSETVRRALDVVDSEAALVAVHDAARPCVTSHMIDAVFAEAAKSGAAILGSPITGTLKLVSESGVIDETASRERLFEAQTPQVFLKTVIVDAFGKLSADAEVTDDAQVIEQSGHPVAVVISDASNLKITAKGDLSLAGAILKSRPAKTASRRGAFEEAQW